MAHPFGFPQTSGFHRTRPSGQCLFCFLFPLWYWPRWAATPPPTLTSGWRVPVGGFSFPSSCLFLILCGGMCHVFPQFFHPTRTGELRNSFTSPINVCRRLYFFRLLRSPPLSIVRGSEKKRSPHQGEGQRGVLFLMGIVRWAVLFGYPKGFPLNHGEKCHCLS